MQFFRIRIFMQNNEDEEVEERRMHHSVQRRGARSIFSACEDYSQKLNDSGYYFLYNAADECLEMGLMIREAIDVPKFIDTFIKQEKYEYEDVYIEEITFNRFNKLLMEAEHNDYMYNSDDILEDFGLSFLAGRGPHFMSYDELIVNEKSKAAIYDSASKYFTNDTFEPELDRIFANGKKIGFKGHPVHYIIETDDDATRKGTSKLLIQSLYNVGRLINKRYTQIDIGTGNRLSRGVIKTLYESSAGGAIILNVRLNNADDSDVAYGDMDILCDICNIANRLRKNVLTIICLSRCCNDIKQNIYECMGGCSFVEIKEELVYNDKAREYLKSKARENGIRPDKKLYNEIEADYGYLTPELNNIFDTWYSRKLKTTVYKQYAEFESVDSKIAKQAHKGAAYDELMEMVGLSSAKTVINQALDFYKARKLFKDKGIVDDSVSQHMIFTGNPGTAKTTVARLFARIMKENGIISRGQIVEVGRGDLVGRYVGWTAPNIQKKFKEALGGVLFIDEAYSLVDDKSGSFGDEAINTIVQEMENYRDDIIVIFAGYPDKMEGFLDKNPGLRSRIAHHVHFEDYNADELCDIAKLIARKKGIRLDDAAVEKLHTVMTLACKDKDFGNGRYVRNTIEKAKLAQSSRLVKMNFDDVTQDDVRRILAEDIVIPDTKRDVARRIGFCI